MVTTAPLQGLAEEHLQLLTPLARSRRNTTLEVFIRRRKEEATPMSRRNEQARFWSGKRDLNPRPSPWQGDALPLSYSRSERMEEECRILLTKSETVKQREWCPSAYCSVTGHLLCYEMVTC